MITHDQMSLIARLGDDPAYQLALDYLQAEVDSAADRLLMATRNEEEFRAVAHWRALKTVLQKLRVLPGEMAVELSSARLPPPPPAAELAQRYGPAFQDYVRALRDRAAARPASDVDDQLNWK